MSPHDGEAHVARAHSPTLGRGRKLCMSLLAVLIVYGNAAVIFHPTKLPLPRALALPRPSWLHDLFLMTGMFSGYSTRNHDYVIEGQVEGPGEPGWQRLDVQDFFAERHAVIYTQLGAVHHWDMHGTAKQREAWARLAVKIRRRHNRLHPDRPVSRVRFGVAQWPLSPQGYRAAKRPETTRMSWWFTEAEPAEASR